MWPDFVTGTHVRFCPPVETLLPSYLPPTYFALIARVIPAWSLAYHHLPPTAPPAIIGAGVFALSSNLSKSSTGLAAGLVCLVVIGLATATSFCLVGLATDDIDSTGYECATQNELWQKVSNTTTLPPTTKVPAHIHIFLLSPPTTTPHTHPCITRSPTRQSPAPPPHSVGRARQACCGYGNALHGIPLFDPGIWRVAVKCSAIS